MKIQESSAHIMAFMIQDMLDYGQIKAGKFRKNIESFNIRESVEEVMSIQRQKANQGGIQLFATYNNIARQEISH